MRKILFIAFATAMILLVGCEYEYNESTATKSDLIYECTNIDYRIDVANGAPASPHTKATSRTDCQNSYYYLGEDWVINYIEENK